MRKFLKDGMFPILVMAMISAMAGGLWVTRAQEVAKNTPAPTATPAPKIEDAKPVIVTKDKLQQAEILQLRAQNAQQQQQLLQVELDRARKTGEEAQKALDEYYVKEIGIARDKLNDYEISPGVDGALILRKKVAPPAEKK